MDVQDRIGTGGKAGRNRRRSRKGLEQEVRVVGTGGKGSWNRRRSMKG